MLRSFLVAALCSIAMGANSDICITSDKYNPDADLNYGTTCDASIVKLIGSRKLLEGEIADFQDGVHGSQDPGDR
jgi:hypothetical protein